MEVQPLALDVRDGASLGDTPGRAWVSGFPCPHPSWVQLGDMVITHQPCGLNSARVKVEGSAEAYAPKLHVLQERSEALRGK